MDINKMIALYDHPKPYNQGTHMMWTDPYIATQLLDIHLNPDINAASRTTDDIDKTVDRIDKMVRPNATILDLGCGPGLYTQRLAMKGHRVTGVDFSYNSLEYAMRESEKNQLKIDYLHENYLNLDFDQQFDLIMMIYCDFGVLAPEDRMALMKMIYKALKPGGIFFFDAIDEETVERLHFTTSWEMSEKGFWKPTPYVCLHQNIHFQENKATLEQHLVIGEDESYQLYRFWNHYFNLADIEKMFGAIGFSGVDSIKDLLGDGGPYNDHGVVFYAVSK